MKQFQTIVDGYLFNGYMVGNDKKPVLVCCHGLTNDAYSFIPLVAYLKDDFHLLLIDGPGHGQSAAFEQEEEYDFSILVKRIKQVVEQITPEPFYIMGHSWGADLALHMAKQYPEKTRGLLLVDGGYVFPTFFTATEEETLTSWKSFVEGSVYSSWQAIRKDFQGYTTRKWDVELDEAIRSTLIQKNGQYVLKSDVTSVLAIMKAFYKVPCTTTYASIKCPVILFHGTVPAGNQAIAAGLKNISNELSDLKIIGLANTQHYPHWDYPQLVAQEIRIWEKHIDIS
ncbi:alpha/beta hydrolase [Kurthia sibirica]|uniref:AB hydrolase-1 domain-containing protein n=1 Tax=Kurthia sibirica TaxID=202750 RepID=A0A2U3AJI3_9BACL|nr:alpha/beta hydrolase [Kurthia sibirica]PWI24699.1 hypothetical protein DEX24_12085 [Kurthia sibirica]GEK34541.1 lipase [Kurthia sibirica]